MTVVQEGGVGEFLRREGFPGDRLLRLAMHMYAALMARNRVRNERGGNGTHVYVGRPKEVAMSYHVVEPVLRQYAQDRVAATSAAWPFVSVADRTAFEHWARFGQQPRPPQGGASLQGVARVDRT